VKVVDVLVWQERTTDDSKESECLKELLSARTHEFIEEVLQPHFGGMIAFVKDCEVVVERGNMEHVKAQESQFPFINISCILCYARLMWKMQFIDTKSHN